MATDWVNLFDLALAQRILGMNRTELARWLDENDSSLREKARKLGRNEALGISVGRKVTDDVIKKIVGDFERSREREWEHHRANVRDDEPFENVRDEIALEAAELEDRPLRSPSTTGAASSRCSPRMRQRGRLKVRTFSKAKAGPRSCSCCRRTSTRCFGRYTCIGPS